MRCDMYIGDSDGTNPQLTCIRAPGHPGGCDAVHGDYQVWGLMSPDHAPVPISYAYPRRKHAELVLERAELQLAGFWMFQIQTSETAGTIDATTFLDEGAAIELLQRLGWWKP